MKLQFTKYLS